MKPYFSKMANLHTTDKRPFPWLATLATLSVAIPMIVYFSLFHGPLDDDQETWSHFATYLTAFASIANLFVVWSIANEAKELNKKGQEENKIFQDAYERPVLYLSQKIHVSYRAWFITNIGRGAALNIKLAIKFTHGPAPNPDEPVGLVKCYSLPADKSTITIDSKVYGVERVFLFYEDLRGRKFVSVANNHETIVRDIDNFSPIEFEHWKFTENDLDSMLKRPTMILADFVRIYSVFVRYD